MFFKDISENWQYHCLYCPVSCIFLLTQHHTRTSIHNYLLESENESDGSEFSDKELVDDNNGVGDEFDEQMSESEQSE